MKIAVLIMSTNRQPSLRNVEAFENTVIKYYNDNKDKFKHDYDFYVYYSDDKERKDQSYYGEITRKENGVYNVCINERESVYRTFEKTYYMFKILNESYYDIFVRINISLWMNLNLLDSVVDQFKSDCVYCNAINSHINGNSEYINDIYPRGDMMIIGRDVFKGIIDNGEKYLYCDTDLKNRINVDHMDDCLVGVCMIDTYGKDYYKHIIPLKYVFVPRKSIYSTPNIMDEYSIGFRVKSTPVGMVSGYSWDDNEYRLNDSKKMIELQNYFNSKNIKYDGTKLQHLFTDGQKEKPTIFIQMSNQSIKNVFFNFLSKKRP